MQTSKLITNSHAVVNYTYALNLNNSQFPYTQILRWKRKPIWLPTAKSKVFRVPQRPVIPKDEAIEIQRLYNNYRTYYRSIRKYFIETVKANKVELDRATSEKTEKIDFEKCFEINKMWNEEIAKQREHRLSMEKEAKQSRILKLVKQRKLNEEKILLEIEEKVKEANKLASTFITRDNIDNVLEDVLNETVNYNVALDSKGNWLKEEKKQESIKTT